MIRVRTITDPLVPLTKELSQLLLPDIEKKLNCSKTVKYPPFVYTLKKKYKWAFSHFGIFLEKLLRIMVMEEDWREKIYPQYLESASLFTDNDISGIVTLEDIYGSMGRFVNMRKYFLLLTKNILYDQEISHKIIRGHPDIIIGPGISEIFDVKTTTKFSSPTMKNGSILQLSAYLSLARANGHNPQRIGFILPMQGQTIIYDLESIDYDHVPFLNYLLNCAKPRIYTIKDRLEMTQYLPIIGSHTLKIKGSVYKSLKAFYSTENYLQPCQIFMRGNLGSRKISVKDEDIAKTLSFVSEHHVRFYVHSPYTINLCYPSGRKSGNENSMFMADMLAQDLKYTNVYGGKGVVVHTGKGMGIEEESAYNKMYSTIIYVLKQASKNCPLLLETPCNKGTELCGSPVTLSKFYLRFSSELRKIFKICVDTCHVYAAGYQPYDYLTKLSELIGDESIHLIHLNDSKWAKGSNHDGHAFPGEGCIGVKEMMKVIKWSSERNIPMVNE